MKQFSIGTLKASGLNDDSKKRAQLKIQKKYKADIICLQETKIKEGIDINTEKGHRIVSLKTDEKSYGNGFIIARNGQTQYIDTGK